MKDGGVLKALETSNRPLSGGEGVATEDINKCVQPSCTI